MNIGQIVDPIACRLAGVGTLICGGPQVTRDPVFVIVVLINVPALTINISASMNC